MYYIIKQGFYNVRRSAEFNPESPADPEQLDYSLGNGRRDTGTGHAGN